GLERILADGPHGLGGDPAAPERLAPPVAALRGAEGGGGAQPPPAGPRGCRAGGADPLLRVRGGVGRGEAVTQVAPHVAVVGVPDQGGFVALAPGPERRPRQRDLHAQTGSTSTRASNAA